MLNNFCAAWNAVYHDHAAEHHTGHVTIVEPSNNAKNKTLTIRCDEAICFPSKQFDGYDMFGALSLRNCDGAVLVATGDGRYDLLYIEMKSRFDSHEVFEAKCQIVETRTKMKSLIQMLKPYVGINIRRIYGVIETQQLDLDQQDLWLKLQQQPDSMLDFGWKLIKYGEIEAPTHSNPNIDMPSEMLFKIVLSDKADYTINYKEIAG